MKKFLSLLAAIALLTACGGGNEFVKTPLDILIRDMDAIPEYTIMLYDMDVEGTLSETYKHRYKIISQKDTASKPEERITDWYEVPEVFFEQHANDMGMELVSKKDGKVTKEVAPAGYSNYVGNNRYGQWKTHSDGSSFWEFYGQYAFMSSMIGMMSQPIYRNSYYDYRDNYRGYGRPYYGPTDVRGMPSYGTNSQHGQSVNPDFQRRLDTKPSFKDKVNDRVQRSSSSSSRVRSGSASRRSDTGAKPGSTSRSSSRYGSSSSSSRSRSSSRGGK